jgi:hypothetical protein
MGGWRKMYNEELHDLYSSPSIIRMIKSRKMKLTGHVALIGREGGGERNGLVNVVLNLRVS